MVLGGQTFNYFFFSFSFFLLFVLTQGKCEREIRISDICFIRRGLQLIELLIGTKHLIIAIN